MAGGVEEMIADANRALLDRDGALAERVIRADPSIDAMEKELDEDCLLLLALQEPKATDFRLVIAVQKIVGELERMGDSAVNIAQGALRLVTQPPLDTCPDLPRLAAVARAMVRGALDAFVRKDAAQAREVCVRDDEADQLYRHCFNDVLAAMKASPSNVERGVHLLLAARNLERIADHSTNVAEDVIYFLEAQDVRHSQTPSALRSLTQTAPSSAASRDRS
jgi:phosphate transport system protein